MYYFKLTNIEEEVINELSQVLQIHVRRKYLYIVALTHKSYFNKLKKIKRKIYSYEKLEFLGDAVLQFIVTDYLFKKFRRQKEGELSALRAYLVRESTLANIIKDLEISKFIFTGKSFKQKVHSSDHVLSDIYESLVAAIYLDRGLKYVKLFITRTLLNRYDLNYILSKKLYLDSKTQLQELIQKMYGITPVYETRIKVEDGLEKYFSCVKINDNVVSDAYGTTKLEAEFSAAAKALKNIDKIIKKINVENKINKNGEKA